MSSDIKFHEDEIGGRYNLDHSDLTLRSHPEERGKVLLRFISDEGEGPSLPLDAGGLLQLVMAGLSGQPYSLLRGEARLILSPPEQSMLCLTLITPAVGALSGWIEFEQLTAFADLLARQLPAAHFSKLPPR